MRLLQTPWLRIAAPALLAVPYLLYALATGEFEWRYALALLHYAGLVFEWGCLNRLPRCRGYSGRTWLCCWCCALTLELGLLSGAWPHPGMGSLPKLYLCDIALYLYLVVRGVEGVGYCFTPKRKRLRHRGTRVALLHSVCHRIGICAALHKFSSTGASAAQIAAGVLVTFLLTAVPEELFFRGLLQNLLEPHLGRLRALAVASVLFGLSHFHKGRGFQLALCSDGRRRRSLLRTRLASPAAIAGFQHHAHHGGCGVVTVVQVEAAKASIYSLDRPGYYLELKVKGSDRRASTVWAGAGTIRTCSDVRHRDSYSLQSQQRSYLTLQDLAWIGALAREDHEHGIT